MEKNGHHFGRGEVYLRVGMLKNHRAENGGNVEWKVLGKRSTLATEREGTDIDTAANSHKP